MLSKESRTTMLYHTVHTLCKLLSWFPFRVLYILSDLIFLILYHLIRYRRKVVQHNLTTSFPDKTPAQIRHIRRQFYRFFCDYFVETIKLTTISPRTMLRHMTFRGVEELEQAALQQDNKLLFMYLGHYCNWEWVASLPYAISPQIHCAQIYHPLYNKAVDRLFLNIRNQFGGECIPMKSTLRRIIELKRQGQPTVIGFISDQLPKWNSIHYFVPFLHHDTAVFTGAEQIGRQVKAAYFFVHMQRPRRGHYICTFQRMTPNASHGTEYPYTTLFMEMLEDMIQKAPQYWLWTHKRWKRTKEEWLQRQQAQASTQPPQPANTPQP